MKIVAALLVVVSLIVQSHSQSRGALRLVRDGEPTLTQAWNSGIVQIYYNSGWGNICYDSYFGQDEADVICHQLSSTGASYHTSTSSTSIYGTDSASIIIEDVTCSSSNLLVLLQCSVSSQYSSYCSSSTNYDAIVYCYNARIWDNPFSGQIRLRGGDYSNQGLLEVYCGGQWGTVCDDDYYDTEARVSCRQLGYNVYTSYDQLTIRGNTSQPIWFQSFSCFPSTTTCVRDCAECPTSSVSICSHSEDITLDCAYQSTTSSSTVTDQTCQNTELSDTTGPSSVGAIRLLNGGSTSLYNTAGRVQVWYGGQWGNICDNGSPSFGYNEADVICHQLSWSGSSSYSTAGNDGYGIDYLPSVIDDVDCTSSNYLTIFQCTYSTIIDSSCTQNDDISVTCYTTRIWDSAYTGQIRLSKGQYSNQGLLEVYCNGQWGTVCDDSFGSTDATVACAQLGYSRYYTYNTLTITGNISQPIWFDDVYCASSSYNCLANCVTCPSSQYHNCGHSEDVALDCSVASTNDVFTATTSCDGVDTGPTDDSSNSDGSSSISGAVSGVIGSTIFIVLISVGIPVFIVICVTSRTRAGYRRNRLFAQPQAAVTTAAVVNQPEYQLQQAPTTTTTASYPVQGYTPNTNPQNPPFNPTVAYNIPYGQNDQQYPYPVGQPAAPYAAPYPPQGNYSTTPQQPPPSYTEYIENQQKTEAAFPPGAVPPGAVPGTVPPGTIPPGPVPPGAVPPGPVPPGPVPPGAMPPPYPI